MSAHLPDTTMDRSTALASQWLQQHGGNSYLALPRRAQELVCARLIWQAAGGPGVGDRVLRSAVRRILSDVLALASAIDAEDA